METMTNANRSTINHTWPMLMWVSPIQVIHEESLARGPKLLSITNYFIETMT